MKTQCQWPVVLKYKLTVRVPRALHRAARVWLRMVQIPSWLDLKDPIPFLSLKDLESGCVKDNLADQILHFTTGEASIAISSNSTDNPGSETSTFWRRRILTMKSIKRKKAGRVHLNLNSISWLCREERLSSSKITTNTVCSLIYVWRRWQTS